MLKRFVGRVYSSHCMEEVRMVLESQSPPIQEFTVTTKQFVHNGVGVITKISAAQLLPKNQQWFYKHLEQNPNRDFEYRDFVLSEFEPENRLAWLVKRCGFSRDHFVREV